MTRRARSASSLPCFACPGYFRLQCSSTVASLPQRRTSWTISFQTSSRRVVTDSNRTYYPNKVICAANNGDWERFQSRASESLQSTGRFFQSSTGQAVLWGGLVWLVLTGRVGWIFDSVLYLLLFFSVVPIIGVLVLRWWLNRQLVQGTCPSCGSPVTGLKNQAFQCLNCGQVVRGEQRGDFSVNDPASATIDIDAKRVD